MQLLFPRLLMSMISLSLAIWPRASHSAAFRPGAALMKLRPVIALAQARAALPAGATIEGALGDRLYAVRVPLGMEQRYIDRIAALPQVAYAQLDHAAAAQITPDDPHYAEQWSLPRIGMPATWAVVTDTSALTIAVLDSGVTLNHPDLQGQLWINPGEIADNQIDDDGNGYVDDVSGWHFYHTFSGGQALPGQNNDVRDENGHGTHVAGIIAAAGDNGEGIAGIAWRARLMPVRVLDQDAVGWESDIIQGLDYAVANGASVVNLSLGLEQAGPALAEAVADAEEHGLLLVAAAGNNGGAVLYPAAYPTVLSVGASDRSNQRASFSSRGPRLDMLAPGVDILSTWNGLPYFSRSGTSMAAPHVAGVAALLRTHIPYGTPAQLRSCLLRAAIDLGSPGRDADTGAGLLSAAVVTQPCVTRTYLPLATASPATARLDRASISGL
jgi:subtilisin family serine protease